MLTLKVFYVPEKEDGPRAATQVSALPEPSGWYWQEPGQIAHGPYSTPIEAARYAREEIIKRATN